MPVLQDVSNYTTGEWAATTLQGKRNRRRYRVVCWQFLSQATCSSKVDCSVVCSRAGRASILFWRVHPASTISPKPVHARGKASPPVHLQASCPLPLVTLPAEACSCRCQ